MPVLLSTLIKYKSNFVFTSMLYINVIKQRKIMESDDLDYLKQTVCLLHLGYVSECT